MIRSGLWVSWERPQKWCAIITCHLLSLWLLTVDSTLNTWRSLALSSFSFFYSFPFHTPDQVAYWSRIRLPVQETEAQCLGQEDPLEEEIATHSSLLAWNIPWTQERGGLQSMGLQRVRNDWAHIHGSLWWNVEWAHFCGLFYSFNFLLEFIAALPCYISFCCTGKWIGYSHTHRSPLLLDFLPIQVATERGVDFPVLYSRISLVIYFMQSINNVWASQW